MRPSVIARMYNIYTPMLGRWAITYNYKLQNVKIDGANTDHCGCCEIKYVEHSPSTAPDTHKSMNVNINTNEIELLPYCM